MIASGVGGSAIGTLSRNSLLTMTDDFLISSFLFSALLVGESLNGSSDSLLCGERHFLRNRLSHCQKGTLEYFGLPVNVTAGATREPMPSVGEPIDPTLRAVVVQILTLNAA